MNRSLILLLGLLMFSFLITSVLIVPFINLLYKFKFQKLDKKSKDAFGLSTPIFNQFHQKKIGIPIGGGFLIVLIVISLFALIMPLLHSFHVDVTAIYKSKSGEIGVILFTFISFALLGLVDDLKKFFTFKHSGVFGLRMRHKFILELILAFFIACLLFFHLGISILHVPFVGTFNLGWFYLPFAAFVIVAFANAVNITDGLDGLAAGTMMISLFGLWLLSSSILDIPLSVFIALWLGSLISFLYFNIYPARLFMGDVGSLSFGATLAVIGLLLGKPLALIVIGFIFIIEITSAFLQLLSKKFRKKRILPAAPFHLTLQYLGWAEPKIVQRAWLTQIMFTILGVWLAVL